MLTVILTGGRSSRMGRDKALLPLGDGTFLSQLVSRYRKALGRVAVSVDRAGRFSPCGALELVDAFPGKGPMNGLYSAFTQTDADTVFLTATDLPAGDPALARYLAERLEDCDACVIRRGDDFIEPLFAVYARSCLPVVRAYLETDCRAVHELLRDLRVRFVPESKLTAWALDLVLMNVNTPEDYARLQRAISR